MHRSQDGTWPQPRTVPTRAPRTLTRNTKYWWDAAREQLLTPRGQGFAFISPCLFLFPEPLFRSDPNPCLQDWGPWDPTQTLHGLSSGHGFTEKARDPASGDACVRGRPTVWGRRPSG